MSSVAHLLEVLSLRFSGSVLEKYSHALLRRVNPIVGKAKWVGLGCNRSRLLVC